jgi:hypothetical protein
LTMLIFAFFNRRWMPIVGVMMINLMQSGRRGGRWKLTRADATTAKLMKRRMCTLSCSRFPITEIFDFGILCTLRKLICRSWKIYQNFYKFIQELYFK